MTEISVIVPVYNNEEYLPKCMDSLICQALKDIEIICVNDASEDNSLKILQDYADRDKRIKVINFEQNKGVSAARNYALDIAEGNYIYFLDSDDWIDNDYLEIMLKTMDETCSDIIINRNVISVHNDKFFPYNFQPGQLAISDNSYIDTEKDTHNIFSGLCCKLYNANLIKKYNIRFPEGYIYEDNFFHYVSFAYAQKVYFFNGSSYYYRKNDTSITANHRQDSDKFINILGLIYDYYKEHGLLGRNIKIYYTMPLFSIDNEHIYSAFKEYFLKAGGYILNSNIYTDVDKFFCKNISETNSYDDYISKFSKNVAISYIKRKNKVLR